MSLLFGLSLAIGLLLMTGIVLYIFDYTKEFPIALVGVMIFGDMILSGLWFLVGSELLPDVQKLKYGMGLSFALISFSRALIFFIYAKKRDMF